MKYYKLFIEFLLVSLIVSEILESAKLTHLPKSMIFEKCLIIYYYIYRL